MCRAARAAIVSDVARLIRRIDHHQTIPPPMFPTTALRLLPFSLILAAGACDRAATETSSPLLARAVLRSADGADLGRVDMRQESGSPVLTLRFQVHGLSAGQHGVHLHTVGSCDGSTATPFSSAGAHFNPGGMMHGLLSPSGPHAGDLPNLVVGADGTADVTISTERAGLGSIAPTLFDVDGSAIVVHAASDDQKTDPSGNSGGRVACGVVAPVA